MRVSEVEERQNAENRESWYQMESGQESAMHDKGFNRSYISHSHNHLSPASLPRMVRTSCSTELLTLARPSRSSRACSNCTSSAALLASYAWSAVWASARFYWHDLTACSQSPTSSTTSSICISRSLTRLWNPSSSAIASRL